MEQRFAFDQVANLYRAVRADYPEALVDDVVAYAGVTPDDTALEVGCGTGQATKSFARHSFPILAIDPGPELVRAAQETLAAFGNVAFTASTFEALTAKPASFRLIFAAQSWHWVAPQVAIREGRRAAVTPGIARRVRPCSRRTARTVARTIRADIPRPHRLLGAAA